MNIKFNPQNSMIAFHNSNSVLHLVDLCLNNIESHVFDDILALIKRPNLTKAEKYFDAMRYDYSKKDEMDIFYDLKKTITTIYNHKNMSQLRGAFLEVLSFNIFRRLYPFEEYSVDCNVIVDGWDSQKTVDIGIKCENKGIISECKISRRRFNKKLICKLLEIKSRANDYFSIFLITLEGKSKIYDKLEKISKYNPELDLSQIFIVHRGIFKDFYKGSFERYKVNLNN